ncbi:uncharacterized protein VTP21DRAFT_6220 [Calcarisporiella thermophila]|uniref:uncharacterized protein n=1 Tax=Calcarisporiella thermophila TaxID=911321 RepID=UPI0037426FBB
MVQLDIFYVNPIALLVGSLFEHLVGYVIYGASPLGRIWMLGMRADKRDDKYPSNARFSFQTACAYSFLSFLTQNYFLGVLLKLAHVQSLQQASLLAALVVMGVLFPKLVGELLWESRPLSVLGVRGLNGAACCLGSTVILYALGVH